MRSSQIKNTISTGSNKFSVIRKRARTKCESANKLDKCQKCGYDKHVEVCHIKPISAFNLEDSIEQVNSWDNLLILCPNCHWEHDNADKPSLIICECGQKKDRTSVRCRKCNNKFVKENGCRRHFVRPSKEELINLVNEYPMSQLSIKLNVSDVTIKKWCQAYNIDLGERRGYWAKKRCKLVVRASGASGNKPL